MFLYMHRAILAALVLVMLAACSNSEDQVEQDRIKQATDKIAQEAVNRIKTPIDRAKIAKELSDKHNRDIEKNIKPQ